MPTYASNTTVSPERSRAEIEQTLRRYGADAFSYGYDGDRAAVAFRLADRHVRFEVRVPTVQSDQVRLTKAGVARSPGQARAARDKIERQRWRALLLVIKAKLESVESEIETLEEAFLAHIVVPDGGTVGEWLTPQIALAYEGGNMPALLPAGS
jgi:hypothetical protein